MRGGKGSLRWGLGAIGLAAALATVAHAATGSLTVPDGTARTGAAKCADGKIATGGGFSGETPVTWEVLGFRPAGRRWSVRLYNGEGDEQEVTIHAVCKNAERYTTRKRR